MMRMGLDPQDIEIIIISHGHFDHTGSLEYLKELTGASVGMSEADYQLATIAGEIPERDENDFVITDGMEITLGDTTLTALVTPGHTPAPSR
ncbi:MBL fold metallo-hydrolase [Pseudoroseicyclus tamaricis]|uniref:MBL fold metallo-hydrolase n=1 Tax=Pseudoroseicyclus tamaricis TaxID=2705421 RepID=A0A6B2JV45_9RHOB|nr:MBL fold metallo-hydrolase [Pseudoroseicyclus tamaricis]NDV00499.1 MBL fold metallo-hydrolase [Pseudoroseicyclus tamaricis]